MTFLRFKPLRTERIVTKRYGVFGAASQAQHAPLSVRSMQYARW
jgi:hypothetical protein